jgi:CDP-6-deoxy-D-xylo-4-hexulose-3-dehydrase
MEKGIEVRPIVAGNMARQPFFKYEVGPLPNADIIHTRGFYMPNHPDLTEEEQSDLCDVFAV